MVSRRSKIDAKDVGLAAKQAAYRNSSIGAKLLLPPFGGLGLYLKVLGRTQPRGAKLWILSPFSKFKKPARKITQSVRFVHVMPAVFTAPNSIRLRKTREFSAIPKIHS